MQGLDLSPTGLFTEAGLVGKAVMAVLFIASLWCWVLIIEGVISVVRLRRAVRAARADGKIAKSLSGITAAGEEEAHRRIPGETVSEVRARIRTRWPAPRASSHPVRGRAAKSRGHIVRRAVRRPVRHGLGDHGELRRDRAGAGHKPRDRRAGIAESLAATAYGLAAAIPASIGYNRIGAAYARLGQEMASFVEERAVRLISRPAEVALDGAPRRRTETP